MNANKIFRIKIGFCHILPDRIIVTKDENVYNTIKEIPKVYSKIGFFLYDIVAPFSVFILAYMFYDISDESNTAIFIAIILLYFGLLITYNALVDIFYRNYSSSPIIYRKSIKEVKFFKPIFMMRESGFLIIFEDENVQLRHVYIRMWQFNDDAKTAKKIFVEEKLINLL